MNRCRQMKCVVIGLLLVATLSQVSANPRIFNLSDIDPAITRIEYSIGTDPWADADLGALSISLPHSASEDFLFLRMYKGSTLVGDPYAYRFDESLGTWVYIEPAKVILPVATAPSKPEPVKMTLSPYATLMVTDKNLRHMYTLPAGVGVNMSLSFPFHRNLIFNADVTLDFAKSNNIWANSFITIGTDVGVGYTIPIGERFAITPSLSYGLFFHFGLSSILAESSFMTHHVGADIAVGYDLASDMSIFVSPHLQYMIDSSGSGFLYGLRTGVGFAL